MLVEAAMTVDPVTVAPTDSLKHALELLGQHRISSLPVVRGNRLCGVVSETDLVRDLVAHDPRTQLRPFEDHATGDDGRGARLAGRVEDVMSTHVVTVHPETDLAVAVDLLTTTTVTSLPVVDSYHRLRGVISRSDVVRRYARADETLAADVRAALVSVGLEDWVVEVRDGTAEVTGPDGAAHADLTLARVMASHVPGVVDVRTR